jgi:hypothetical protein
LARFLERRTAVIFGAGKKATKKRAKSFGRIKTIITFAAPNKGNSCGMDRVDRRSERSSGNITGGQHWKSGADF